MRAIVLAAFALIAGVPGPAHAASPVADAARAVADAVRALVRQVEPPMQQAAGKVADAVRALCPRFDASEAWPPGGNPFGDWYRRGQQMIESLAPRQRRSWNGVVRPREEGIDRQMAVVPPEPHGTLRIIPPPGAPGGDATIEPR